MKIEVTLGKVRPAKVTLGKVRPAKAKESHPEWFVRIIGDNGEILWRSSEGYKKLASAINMIESTLVGLSALTNQVVNVFHNDGKTEDFHFVHSGNIVSLDGRYEGAGACKISLGIGEFVGRRFAYHYRKSFGMLVSSGKKKRK
jgi:uncharacterized protein YegP (UPF0339 family)